MTYDFLLLLLPTPKFSGGLVGIERFVSYFEVHQCNVSLEPDVSGQLFNFFTSLYGCYQEFMFRTNAKVLAGKVRLFT